MYLQCFAIKDLKVGTFGRPFFSRHVAEAIRDLSQVVTDPSSVFSKFPADFELWLICSMNDENGMIQLSDNMGPSFVIGLLNIKSGGSNEQSQAG